MNGKHGSWDHVSLDEAFEKGRFLGLSDTPERQTEET
jgi:hypothetical protein